jgi:TatD DNase family protein
MELWDTHCHLTFPPLAEARADVLARAAAAEVRGIVVPAYDVASWGAVAALRGTPGVRLALGVHPWAARDGILAARLDAALADTGAAAVGEVGLDFKIEGADRARQIALLEAQLDVAEARGLPVLLHCRGAFEELLEILRRRQGRVRGVVHAFSRGPALAARFVDLGLHVAFGGAITRPSAERAKRSAAAVPPERLLLETDAPSIGLDGVPPEATEPRHVRDVARALAFARGIDEAEVARITTANAGRLFGRDPV